MRKNKWPDPAKGLAQRIVDRWKPYEDSKRRHAFNETIVLLQGGRKEAVREYYVQKCRSFILTAAAMLCLLAAALIASRLQSRQISDGMLERPGYQGDAAQQELTVMAEGESEEQALTVTVSGRRFTKNQIDQMLQNAEEEFDLSLPGENVSVDEVRTDLVLPDAFADGAVQASYVMVPYGIIAENGSLVGSPEKEGTLVEIQVTLTCQEEKRELLRTVRVLPPVLTTEEAFWKQVQESLEKADKEDQEEKYMVLPDEVDQKKLHWQYPRQPWAGLALAALLIVPLLIWYLSDSRVQEQAQKRDRQLKLDYGELMWKMTMLSGAGLTIRAVFFRIAKEYMEEQHSTPRYTYEEIVRTCREMKSGVPEATAYENFGRRCGQQSYMRLGSLLSQNLKKGSKGLAEILEKEAVTAMDERRGAARETGEKAATKLLMPMLLLLMVVLIALTLPCVMSF